MHVGLYFLAPCLALRHPWYERWSYLCYPGSGATILPKEVKLDKQTLGTQSSLFKQTAGQQRYCTWMEVQGQGLCPRSACWASVRDASGFAGGHGSEWMESCLFAFCNNIFSVYPSTLGKNFLVFDTSKNLGNLGDFHTTSYYQPWTSAPLNCNSDVDGSFCQPPEPCRLRAQPGSRAVHMEMAVFLVKDLW